MLKNLLQCLLLILCSLVYAQSNTAKSKQIHELLNASNKDAALPGLIAAIVDKDGIDAIASTGVRKIGIATPLTIDDQIHLGSCTKAMTSTLLAILITDNKLKWESTITDILPELKSDIHKDYHDVSLWQLVSHRSGMAANAANWWGYRKLSIQKQRIAILKENLKGPSANKKGDYLYSNLAYMVAGCMAEKVSGQSWEVLMQKRLFAPLSMKTAGFGPPGNRVRVDQPWGHSWNNNQWQPKYFDNAAALGPAGTVHASFEDWAKFIALQFQLNKQKLLPRKSLDRLVKADGQYGGGWFVGQRKWAGGIVLSHSGSNTMWYAIVWVAPKKNKAYIVATNSKNQHSAKFCDKIVSQLISLK